MANLLRNITKTGVNATIYEIIGYTSSSINIGSPLEISGVNSPPLTSLIGMLLYLILSKYLCHVNTCHNVRRVKKMKKTVSVLCLLLLLIPAFSITAVAVPEPKLEIEIRGVWSKNIVINRNFRIFIENLGDETALDTDCDIWVSGGFPLNARTYWGYNAGDINPGTSKILPFHDFKLPLFGIIEMTVQVQADNVELTTKSINAIALGFIWIIY